MAHRILVADDEPHIREVICFALERAGLRTITARNGNEVLMTLGRGDIDLIVLDVGMPELDGIEACRQIRRSSDVPVLFLSARDEETDRLRGLETGGDDYVTKPFSTRELVARVGAILRRASGRSERAWLRHGRLSLDTDGHEVRLGDSPVGLTPVEFAILRALLTRPEAVLSRDQLMDAAYGPGTAVADRTIDSHVRNLRAKLGRAGAEPLIVTVHGVGFRLGAAP